MIFLLNNFKFPFLEKSIVENFNDNDLVTKFKALKKYKEKYTLSEMAK